MTRRKKDDGLAMEALLHTLRRLTPVAQVLCLVLLVCYACSGIRFIGPEQTALVLRLGKLRPVPHTSGLLLAWPAPIDEVYLIETGTEHTLALEDWSPRGPRLEQGRHTREATAEEIAAGTAVMAGNQALPVEVAPEGDSFDPVTDGYTLTGDWNVVQGRFTLRYRITDPVAYFNLGDKATALLSRLSRRATTRVLSTTSIDRGLTDGRALLASSIRASLDDEARLLGLGVSVTAFEIREIAPPRQVAAAFEEVTNARLFAKTLAENAEEYRLKQITLAEGQAAAIRRRSEGASRQLVAASRGESAAFGQFRAQYARNPQLLRERLYAETVSSVMQHVHSTTVLPRGEAPPSILLEPNPTATR
jgi:modulator of FtsH protease HflK